MDFPLKSMAKLLDWVQRKCKCMTRVDVFSQLTDLIYHYITAHGYQPPKEFVDAVMSIDL